MSQCWESSKVLSTATDTESGLRSNEIVKNYLLEREAVFCELCQLRSKVRWSLGVLTSDIFNSSQGWSSVEGDTYFQQRRKAADNPTPEMRQSFFRMTVKIGDEMARKTRAFSLHNRQPLVLDLCMAPGGFTKSVMTRFPEANVHAITLPPEKGGHQVIVQGPNLSIVFADITMYAADFGVKEIPIHHPDVTAFSMDRPFSDSSYDMVFCGGAVLRTHQRSEYREKGEGARLTLSQLIFSFQRIKPGGTLVLLLHRVETWETLCILRTFNSFADIRLFKPYKAHAIKSSFYLIARNVRPEHVEAVKAVAEWKRVWYDLTFDISEDKTSCQLTGQEIHQDVVTVLEEFGPRLIELGRPIWRMQAKALRSSQIVKGTGLGPSE
jgi:23S rRNA U2552 (ribose-2'-O)-methylase RlmE/FtsJ